MGKDPPAAKMPWGYLSSKMIEYNMKGLYTLYIQQDLYKVLSINVLSLCVVHFKWAINSQESLCARE